MLGYFFLACFSSMGHLGSNMEHIALEDEVWAWKGADAREDASKACEDDIDCPAFSAAQLAGARKIGYWGALGESVVCEFEGRQYIVCSTGVRRKDEYLLQRIRGMMAHALASFATVKFPYVWTSELGWLQTVKTHDAPPIVLDDLIPMPDDDEWIAEPKIRDAESAVNREFTLARHVLLLQSHLRPLDLVLRSHLPGCERLASGDESESGGHGSGSACWCWLSLCAGAVAALEELHTNGLMHNDVRTSSLIARSDGSMLLGAMWSCSVPGGKWWNREIPGDWLLWRAPEARQYLLCDSHSDVFSLGLVLLHIFGVYCGAIDGCEHCAIPAPVAAASLEYRVPEEIAVHMPPSLLAIVNQMLEEESFDRPDCFEVTAVLDEIFVEVIARIHGDDEGNLSNDDG